MNTSIEWDNDEKTILRVTLHDGLSAGDIIEAMDKTLDQLDTAHHTVDFLLDFRLDNPPKGWMSSFPQIAAHPLDSHQYFGVSVVITQNRFVQTIGKIFATYTNRSIYITGTEAQAYQVIKEAVARRKE